MFQNCTIKNLTNSYITAASTKLKQKFGYVFFDCRLIADTWATKCFLGRPWRPYAKTVFINTDMGAHIVAEDWNNWNNPKNEKTVLYAQYKSKGAGANSNGRVKWVKQLTASEAEKYTLENIFAGKVAWVPEQ